MKMAISVLLAMYHALWLLLAMASSAALSWVIEAHTDGWLTWFLTPISILGCMALCFFPNVVLNTDQHWNKIMQDEVKE